MLVTLLRAQTSYFEDVGLRGFLDVECDGTRKTYSFRLPTEAEPTPPGWTTIEQLSGVSAQAAIDGWDETFTRNAVAHNAILFISSRYAATRFVAREIHSDKSVSIELTPLDTAVAAPRRLLTEASPQIEQIRYSYAFHMAIEAPLGRSSELVVRIADVDESKWLRFKIPDQNDRTPEDWWFIETFTGISHERIVTGWTRQGNTVLDDTMQLFREVIEANNRVPVREDGRVDLNRWRRELIRARLRVGVKPFVFLGRPDHNVEHTRAVFYDAAGDFIFRTAVEPGKSRGIPIMIVDAEGKAMIEPLDNEKVMRSRLNRYIRFARSGRPPKPVQPPKELVDDLILCPDRSWPVIEGLVRIPTVREDGSIITQAGYDVRSKLWYAPEFDLEPVPDQPTLDDVQRARALLLTPIADFPFVNEGARTGALASLLEQVVRPMIKGPRPLYIFDAPADIGQGSGKSLLAKVFQVIITGNPPTITALGKKEEEIEKRITTVLKQQEPYVIFDNLTRELTSEALQQLATSERWQARLLNTNEAPIYPQTMTPVLTLNGAKMNRDIKRRSVLSSLDAKTPNAYERTGFKIPEDELIDWVRDRRAALIRACLVLVRAWIAAGRPIDPGVVRGSFAGWCRVIGGIMKHGNFVGLAQCLRAASERDISIEDHQLFIRAWLADYAIEHKLPAVTLGELAQRHGLYEERLPKRAQNLSLGKHMARILSGMLGQTIDGFAVEKAGVSNGYTTYSLVPVAPASLQ